MQRYTDDQILYSPTDLVTFLSCHHASFLDNRALHEDLERSEESSTNQLLQKRGMEHEAAYLQHLREEGRNVVEIPKSSSLAERAELTRKAMRSGVDVVYQGVFFTSPWRGDADFLVRCETPSALGEFSYEVLDTKLARHAEVKHILQICMYSELLAEIQKLQPLHMHLVLGTGIKESFTTSEYFAYYTHLKKRFAHYIRTIPSASVPEPCPYCGFCHWKERCEREWEETDHLSLIANIQRTHENTLRKAGIHTISELASCKKDRIPGMMPGTFLRLRSQAALQHHERSTGEKVYSLLEQERGKGFSRIPLPAEGDLFFDMEGDPLYPDGLEYLFGVHTYINREHRFIPFWAHDHEQEEKTFDVFMNFLKDHLTRYPQAFIYHYNHYETTALKRLACRYARHEEMLDNLLRHNLFVDLYVVVRESLRTSQPGYSIKNMEAFYMDKRKNTVATATDSIVVYNTWRETGEASLLQEIADYNEVDCVSTRLLRDWLVSIRPRQTPWYTPGQNDGANSTDERKEWEIEYERFRIGLEKGSSASSTVSTRIIHLLEFHNREAKPQWWKMFSRQTKEEDELIEDTECLAGLSLAGSPTTLKRSRLWTYHFPPQDYKLKPDDTPTLTDTMESAGTIFDIDNAASTVTIKLAEKNNLPPRLSLGPPKPINTQVLRQSIYTYASRIMDMSTPSQVATEILSRSNPRITGKEQGEAIVTHEDLVGEAQEAVAHLNSSYLFIQGPPGAGKTYISSHIIVDLLKRGMKIGVSSNSHKAVHNLLEKVEQVAQESGFAFRGVKKATRNKKETEYTGRFIHPAVSVPDMDLSNDLFAGTAWTFSHSLFQDKLDYLFIDEAGQVSTANVVAMANAARNIILVGDQMQLGQAIQGVHPGEAGLSILEFLLGDCSTIPQDRGIFLGRTYRMDPAICSFISDAFYDGKLKPHEITSRRRLELEGVDLPDKGIAILEADHEGCSQKSEEEGEIIKETYLSLIGQRYIDEEGTPHELTEHDILVVTPYNVQVNYLTSILPEKARVGTVDKFQGQEAPVVLVSMVTSSGEYMPRDIEFLYSPNRLNVALSRAQCLAVVVANPRLQETSCSTVQQMRLVNTFCRLFEYVHPNHVTCRRSSRTETHEDFQ